MRLCEICWHSCHGTSHCVFPPGTPEDGGPRFVVLCCDSPTERYVVVPFVGVSLSPSSIVSVPRVVGLCAGRHRSMYPENREVTLQEALVLQVMAS